MLNILILILIGALFGMIVTSVVYTVLIEKMSNTMAEQINNAKSRSNNKDERHLRFNPRMNKK